MLKKHYCLITIINPGGDQSGSDSSWTEIQHHNQYILICHHHHSLAQIHHIRSWQLQKMYLKAIHVLHPHPSFISFNKTINAQTDRESSTFYNHVGFLIFLQRNGETPLDVSLYYNLSKQIGMMTPERREKLNISICSLAFKILFCW